MIENWAKSFARVILSEGGYVNDPHDHGEETNLGVTKVAWSQFIGRNVHPGEMAALTIKDVEPFYKSCYWNACHCDALPSGLDYAVFDFAVNAGPGRAIRYMQQAVGTVDDGIIGPQTLAAIAKADPRLALDQFGSAKASFYKRLVDRDPDQQKFIKGWLARLDRVQHDAATMLA